MRQIEKTIFISYRRTNIYTARAVYQELTKYGYDCFLDYQSINSGAFDQIILNQIKARAHFILILTPSALIRCSEQGDWLRREIETAIDHKRNIVPLMFEGFDYGDPSLKKHLTDKLSVLSTYNALRVPPDFFEEAMARLMNRFLNIPLEMVLHPTSPAEQLEVNKRQKAASAEPIVTGDELSAEEYFEQGLTYPDNEQKILAYTAAIKRQPNHAEAYHNRGTAYDELGEFDKAIADYTRSIELDNTDLHISYNNRGLSYKNKGEIDQAMSDYTKAINFNPEFPLPYINRGNIYDDMGEHDLALADYDEALRLDPDMVEAYINRGVVYDNQGLHDEAIANYTEAIQRKPDFADTYNGRAYALYQKGDIQSLLLAMKDVNKALQLKPNEPYSLHTRGAIRMALGDLQAALQDFEAALLIEPDMPEALEDIEKVRRELKQ